MLHDWTVKKWVESRAPGTGISFGLERIREQALQLIATSKTGGIDGLIFVPRIHCIDDVN